VKGVVGAYCHHPDMSLISREYARSLFADLTSGTTIPLDPDELVHMPHLRWHGQVFFGDIALRAYKHKARWMFEERDIRRAGQAFAELRLDGRSASTSGSAGSSIAATGKTGGFAPRRAGPVGAGSPVSIHPHVVSEIR
jgi:hypothetical protein